MSEKATSHQLSVFSRAVRLLGFETTLSPKGVFCLAPRA